MPGSSFLCLKSISDIYKPSQGFDAPSSVPAGGRSTRAERKQALRKRHRHIQASPCAHTGLTESLHRLVTVPLQPCSLFPWPLLGEGCRCHKGQAIKGQVYLIHSQPLPVICQETQLSAFRAASRRGLSLSVLSADGTCIASGNPSASLPCAQDPAQEAEEAAETRKLQSAL